MFVRVVRLSRFVCVLGVFVLNMHTRRRTTEFHVYEKKENEEEEEEIEATDTSRCWRRQILKSGETNNRGVSPEIRSGVGAGGRRSKRSSVGNGKRHVSKSESSCSSANLTREKIRLLYVDYSEQETGKRRGEESFERVRSWSGNHGVLLPVAELDTVSLDRFELATSKD